MDTTLLFRVNRPDVVSETVDDETVVVNLETGYYYSLRTSGVPVWNMIERGATFSQIVADTLARYSGDEAEITETLEALLIKLQEEQLVAAGPAGDGAASEHAFVGGERTPFAFPLFEKYTDMQELLLLDPVHEVTDEGWPHQAEADGAE